MMKIQRFFLGFLVLLVMLGSSSVWGQKVQHKKPAVQAKKPSYNIISGNFTYSFHRPQRDLAVRFGNSLEVGIGSDLITQKNKFILGLSGTLLFGNTVNDDVLDVISNADGNIVGTNQSIGIIGLKERGFYFGTHVGKIFPFIKGSNSGIRFTVGAGLLQHKIRLQVDTDNVNQLRGENIKGFDRLTNGFTFHQFLGYQHFGKSGLFNVFAGIEAYEGFTMSRRSFDNTLMRKDDLKRMDILLGLKFGFMVKFNVGESADDIYY